MAGATTIEQLRKKCEDPHGYGYSEEYLHKVPDAPVVNRFALVPPMCKGKNILSLGCSGSMQELIQHEAAWCCGIDLHTQHADDFKRMDLDHVRDVVRWASRAGIRTNACFMLGYPGEAPSDRKATKRYVGDLARAGVDEVIIPIMTPFPGTPSMKNFPGRRSEELCFSPRWREDYRSLSLYRTWIYIRFFMRKVRYRPLRLLRQVTNVILRRHETKGEMTITRMIRDSYDWHVRRRLGRLTGRGRQVASASLTHR